jgi:hypothetical protein
MYPPTGPIVASKRKLLSAFDWPASWTTKLAASESFFRPVVVTMMPDADRFLG